MDIARSLILINLERSKKTKGGIQGTIKKGKVSIGDSIEIRPGRNTKKGLEPRKQKYPFFSGISRKKSNRRASGYRN